MGKQSVSEKIVTVPVRVEDLYGLFTELRRAEFAVRNVAADASGTYVYLEDAEEKDPSPIVESWVGKPSPSPSPKLLEERMAIEEELRNRREKPRVSDNEEDPCPSETEERKVSGFWAWVKKLLW